MAEPVHQFEAEAMAAVAHLGVRWPVSEVVGRGIDEHLERDRWTTAVARAQTHRGGEVAAGTVAGDGEARAVDIEFLAVCGDEGQRVVTVLQTRRKWELGREAIVDRHDHTTRTRGERARRRIVRVEIADDPTAAVE